MTPLAAYLLLFLAVGVGFIFVHLVAGKLIRPSKTNPEKETIYECGEPTIGSAWVQFDLRFYVVALLFVIFDVEVAFFFPWAEVFGKSNAIRAAAEPKTLAEYNDFAAKVNDLASPRGSVSGSPLTPGVLNSTRERELWRKLETMGRDEYEAYGELKGRLTQAMGQLGQKGHEGIRSLTEQQLAMIQEQGGKLNALLKGVADRQRAAAKETLAAIQKLPETERLSLDKAVRAAAGTNPPAPVASLTDALRERPEQVTKWLELKPLAELRQVPKGEVELLPLTPAQSKTFEKALPERARTLRELATFQVKEVTAAAAAARAALAEAGPVPANVWDTFPPQVLSEFANLTPAKLQAFRALTPEGLAALEAPLVKSVKERTDSLAWLALIEILVFFGVLLVGFAYLWKRGDLAWVRSTAAEEPAKV